MHLNDRIHRRLNLTEAVWTEPAAAPLRFGPDKPVYILTDRETFSAAELFAYSLQARKRATVVGEVTRGGAHSSRSFYLHDHFFAMVSFKRHLNPVTKANWERVGVQPDVAVPAAQALQKAHLLALQPLAAAMTGPLKDEALAKLAELMAALPPGR